MTYDPNLGRWLEDDPIGFEGGDTNLYRYVGDNPVNAVDPSGMDRLPAYLLGQTLIGSWDAEEFFLRMNGGRSLGKGSDEWQWFKKGCVGICSLRTGSYKENRFPHLMTGVHAFRSLADALRYQEGLDYADKCKHVNTAKPTLFALQDKNDILKEAKTLENGEIDPKTLGVTGYIFATAFQDEYGCIVFGNGWMEDWTVLLTQK